MYKKRQPFVNVIKLVPLPATRAFFICCAAQKNQTWTAGLLYEMPKSALRSIDDFVGELHKKFALLPDTDDGVQRDIAINCVLDESNLPEINEEIQRVRELLILEQLQQ